MGLAKVLLSGLLSFLFCQTTPSTISRPKPLVNLGMLAGTQITASSVNGHREVDNPYYGALNLFDGGENRINNINYTTWLTDNEPRHWVKLQFEAPMEVDSVMLEVLNKPSSRPLTSAMMAESDPSASGAALGYRPAEFALDITILQEGALMTRKLPSVEVAGFRMFYPLEKPLEGVTELTVVFPGHSMIEVSELEVMGLPSGPVKGLRIRPQPPTR